MSPSSRQTSDRAFYGRDVIGAARRSIGRFSATARKDRALTAAISSIAETSWTTISPKACVDQLTQRVSGAEVEIAFNRLRFPPATQHVTVRLIVRLVRDANSAHVLENAQGKFLAGWRHHAVLPIDPGSCSSLGPDHGRHAIGGHHLIADLKNGPMAHLPS
jgi:hypothetical protein